jgi:hypothetical protein
MEKNDDGLSQPDTNQRMSVMGMGVGININDPSQMLIEKVTPEHIDKMLDLERDIQLGKRDERKRQQWFNLAIIGIGLLFIGFLVTYLRNDQELMKSIITIVVSFLGGLGTGISVSKQRRDDN